MYAVIFTATINHLDDSYNKMAAELRELAMTEYGCTEFIATSENGMEIAVSYWNDLESIKAWKQNATHLTAQQFGKDAWYKNYRVQVTEILREYGNNDSKDS